jgi:hypothetical protein
MSEVKPLDKDIYNRAKAAGITSILLMFEGGSDEGFLQVDAEYADAEKPDNSAVENGRHESFLDDLYEWAEEAYAFDGNGDGSGPYGFDVTYNLENGLVSMETWETGEVYDAAIVSDLAINEED